MSNVGTSGELSSSLNDIITLLQFSQPLLLYHTLHAHVTTVQQQGAADFLNTSTITGKETDCFTNKCVYECQIPLKKYYYLLYSMRISFLIFWQKNFDTVSTQYAVHSHVNYMLKLHVSDTNTAT
jgi:hypothetical protein